MLLVYLILVVCKNPLEMAYSKISWWSFADILVFSGVAFETLEVVSCMLVACIVGASVGASRRGSS